MEMHQVRYFLAVARNLNFTRAAEECNVAQPSLTRAIKLLEEELGGDLFRRERTLSHLTELGARMLPLLQQCHDSALSAKSLAKQVKSGEVAALTLGLSRSVGMTLLVSHLTELVRAMPGLQLKFVRGAATEIGEALKNGNAEVAVSGRLGMQWDRLDSWPLFTEGYGLLAPEKHRLAGINRAVSLSELTRDRLLVRDYCEQAEELGQILKAHGIVADAQHSVATETDLATLIAAGLGVAIAPNSALLPDAGRRIQVADLPMKRTVYVYGISGRARSPAASMLIKLLRSADWSALAS